MGRKTRDLVLKLYSKVVGLSHECHELLIDHVFSP
jgi:hypothetical protein